MHRSGRSLPRSRQSLSLVPTGNPQPDGALRAPQFALAVFTRLTFAPPITGPTADLNVGIITLLDGATTTSLHLDTTNPGMHTILYSVTDPKGQTGSATRTVIVSAPANDNQASSTPPAADDNPPPLQATASSTTQ